MTLAGSGFKDFVNGVVADASEADGYFMRQAVMQFANVAARDTALSGVSGNGMMAYTEADDMLWAKRGGVWREVWPQYTRRTGDRAAITNNTMVDEGVLKFTADVNAAYHYRGILFVTESSSAADFRYGWNLPASASFNGGGPGADPAMPATSNIGSTAWAGVLNASGATLGYGVDSSGGVTMMPIEGTVLTAGTAGVCNLQVAQITTTAVNLLIKAGSFLRVERMG